MHYLISVTASQVGVRDPKITMDELPDVQRDDCLAQNHTAWI